MDSVNKSWLVRGESDYESEGCWFESNCGQKFLSPRNSVVGEKVMWSFMCGWMREWLDV